MLKIKKVEPFHGELMRPVNKIGEVPDVIYHLGAWGKEPIVCLLAPDAVEAARTSVCIAKLFTSLKD